ncbi:hypothetical protein ELI_0551 [Eubacterium callanderi]|uniref:Uncharacterized protein n=1 Tax=Eubacterium callanderi TaxID=53442 RepID=E3GIT2_9FIRM|nr:hypothetical protein ELI_0551 [Eubacterium callanderi]
MLSHSLKVMDNPSFLLVLSSPYRLSRILILFLAFCKNIYFKNYV